MVILLYVDVRIHQSADEFREVAEPLYRRDPVANTIELTLLAANKFGEDALLLTVWEDGAPIGAALQTPPYPLACNGITSCRLITPVATELARFRPDLDGVRGDATGRWHSQTRGTPATGRTGTVTTSETLYRLGTLRPPVDVSGAHREGHRHRPTGCSSTGSSSSSSRRSATNGTTRRGSGSSTTPSAVGDRFVALGGRRCAGEHGDAARACRGGVAHRAGLHSAGVTRARLRLGRHRRGSRSGAPQRRRRRRAVRRPGQPDVERHLSADRIRSGHRIGAGRRSRSTADRGRERARTPQLYRRVCLQTRSLAVVGEHLQGPRTVCVVAKTKTRTSGRVSNRFWKLLGASTDRDQARSMAQVRASEEFDEKAADLDDEQLRKAAQLLEPRRPGGIGRHPAVPRDRPRGLRTHHHAAAVRRPAARRAADAGGRRRRDGHR